MGEIKDAASIWRIRESERVQKKDYLLCYLVPFLLLSQKLPSPKVGEKVNEKVAGFKP